MKTVRMRLQFLLAVVAITLLAPSGVILAQQGSYQLYLNVLPGYYFKEITPGEEETIYLEIRNSGTAPVTNIRLMTRGPDDWDISLSPENIGSLGAGGYLTIDMNITAPSGTGQGEYMITVIAQAIETRTVTSTMVQVKSNTTLWLWVGVGLGILAVAAFAIIFLRTGRER